MKNQRTTCAAIAVLAIAAMAPANAADLTVQITNIRSAEGNILVQLFAGEENYKSGGAHEIVSRAAIVGELTLTFTGLEAGEYAVRMFHDENGDGKLDTNPLGIPREGYAFSNEAKGVFGPPSYSAMKVILSEPGGATSARMQY